MAKVCPALLCFAYVLSGLAEKSENQCVANSDCGDEDNLRVSLLQRHSGASIRGAASDSHAPSCSSYGCVPYTSRHSCQCNPACEEYQSCCTDYHSKCKALETCRHYGCVGYSPENGCQCNEMCEHYGSCCPDYGKVCQGISRQQQCCDTAKHYNIIPHQSTGTAPAHIQNQWDSYHCDELTGGTSLWKCSESHDSHVEDPGFWHRMRDEVVADEGNPVGEMHADDPSDCEEACDKNPACHSIAFCAPNTCHLKDKKVTGTEARVPNKHCMTIFKSDWTYMSANPALLTPSSGELLTFYAYRAASSKGFNGDKYKYKLSNNNVASLSGALWYLHNEVIGTCTGAGHMSDASDYPWGSRKYGIDVLQRIKVTMKATEPLLAKGMRFSVFKAMDHGEATGPHRSGSYGAGTGMNSMSEWDQFGYTVGCHGPGKFPHAQWQSAGKYPNFIWYSLPGPCPVKPRSGHSNDCKNDYPGGWCEWPTGQGNCTWTYEEAGIINIDDLVGITPHWKDRASFCTECRKEGDKNSGGGCNLGFWGPNIWSAADNEERVARALKKFEEKYPDSEVLPPPPACDFSRAKYGI